MIKIRKYKNTDLHDVCALIRTVYVRSIYARDKNEEAKNAYVHFFDPNVHPEWKRTFGVGKVCFVAFEHDKIIGVVRGKLGKLRQLYVSRQGRGVGRLLMNAYEKEAQKQGVKKNQLNAASDAVGFYQKMGYQKSTGLRRGKYGAMYFPMKKML